MTKDEAIRFWSGMIETVAGREAVQVLIDNVPKCQYAKNECDNIACYRYKDHWLCDQHEDT